VAFVLMTFINIYSENINDMNPAPSFETHVQGNKPVVVDFFAEWCGPCKLMAPVLQDLKRTVGDKATVLKMDIDKNPRYAEQYNIMAVPTLLIFKEGNIVWRKSGVAQVREILQHLTLHMS
jgi:thioredoxin